MDPLHERDGAIPWRNEKKGLIVFMKSLVKKSDDSLKEDILQELRFEPSVKVTDIGVLVKDGIVTLNGYATSYTEKRNVIHAAKRVSGVQVIADEIEVKLPTSLKRNDSDIATAAAHQIDWCTSLDSGTVQVTLSDGRITLEGQVEWWYQKNDAESAVRSLAGITSVNNLITIHPKLAAGDIDRVITAAFERSGLLDAQKIKVEVVGDKVMLRGSVCSYIERDEATRAAWSAPGVVCVDNMLKIDWTWDQSR